MKPKFELGQTVMTRSVADWIDGNEARHIRVMACLQKHQCGDWGEVSATDARLNDAAVKSEDRIMSAYTVDNKTVWVITEHDRSVTTVMFPEDY